MNVDLIRAARTFLFVPGNRPDRFAKAEAAGADVVVIDLEDAVSTDDKTSARDAVAQWLSDGHEAVVRINGADTQWFDADVAMLAPTGAPAMLVSRPMRSVWISAVCAPACSARLNSRSIRRAWLSRRLPASVSSTRWLLRRNSGAPTACSRSSSC